MKPPRLTLPSDPMVPTILSPPGLSPRTLGYISVSEVPHTTQVVEGESAVPIPRETKTPLGCTPRSIKKSASGVSWSPSIASSSSRSEFGSSPSDSGSLSSSRSQGASSTRGEELSEATSPRVIRFSSFNRPNPSPKFPADQPGKSELPDRPMSATDCSPRGLSETCFTPRGCKPSIFREDKWSSPREPTIPCLPEVSGVPSATPLQADIATARDQGDTAMPQIMLNSGARVEPGSGLVSPRTAQPPHRQLPPSSLTDTGAPRSTSYNGRTPVRRYRRVTGVSFSEGAITLRKGNKNLSPTLAGIGRIGSGSDPESTDSLRSRPSSGTPGHLDLRLGPPRIPLAPRTSFDITSDSAHHRAAALQLSSSFQNRSLPSEAHTPRDPRDPSPDSCTSTSPRMACLPSLSRLRLSSREPDNRESLGIPASADQPGHCNTPPPLSTSFVPHPGQQHILSPKERGGSESESGGPALKILSPVERSRSGGPALKILSPVERSGSGVLGSGAGAPSLKILSPRGSCEPLFLKILSPVERNGPPPLKFRSQGGGGGPCPSTLKRKRPPMLEIPLKEAFTASPVSTPPPMTMGEEVQLQEEVKESSAEGPGFAVYCKRGRRRCVMEDRFQAVRSLGGQKDLLFFGVFDGHGGTAAAEFASQQLHLSLQESLQRHRSSTNQEPLEPPSLIKPFQGSSLAISSLEPSILGPIPDSSLAYQEFALVEAYTDTDRRFLSLHVPSGASCVSCLVTPTQVTLGHAGDCRAVLSLNGQAVPLTADHKASRVDERERIEALGGHVDVFTGIWRVQGVLAVTRGIGDKDLKEYITAVPETRTVRLERDGDFLVMASDGLWDVVSNEEAVSLVKAVLAPWQQQQQQQGGGDVKMSQQRQEFLPGRQQVRPHSPLVPVEKEPTGSRGSNPAKPLLKKGFRSGSSINPMRRTAMGRTLVPDEVEGSNVLQQGVVPDTPQHTQEPTPSARTLPGVCSSSLPLTPRGAMSPHEDTVGTPPGNGRNPDVPGGMLTGTDAVGMSGPFQQKSGVPSEQISQACRRLVELAVSKGSGDDICVMVVLPSGLWE